jgi:thiol-disulfide isomerase/thioredoxin
MKSIVLALSLAFAAALAPAQVAAPALEGRTVEGQPFKLSALKGKVVLVMFWSTECAVCRDKMSELRRNYEGWNGKPFEMVLVSTDRKMADLQQYEQIISRTVPLKQRFVQLWAGDAGYKDSFGKHAQLPALYLVDKSGKIVDRYVGRMPAEAWDKVAELL